jgi:hypothetical protein
VAVLFGKGSARKPRGKISAVSAAVILTQVAD